MPYLSAKQKIKIGEISLVVKRTMSYALSSLKQILKFIVGKRVEPMKNWQHKATPEDKLHIDFVSRLQNRRECESYEFLPKQQETEVWKQSLCMWLSTKQINERSYSSEDKHMLICTSLIYYLQKLMLHVSTYV
jgi:hypothetical protein